MKPLRNLDERAIGIFIQHAKDCCWRYKKPIIDQAIELIMPGPAPVSGAPRYVKAVVRAESGRLHFEWAEPGYEPGVRALVLNCNKQLRKEADRG